MNFNLISRLFRHPLFPLIPFSFTALLGAVFFLPLQHPSSLIASFDANMIAISLGLVGGLLLLQPKNWRPFNFPIIAILPMSLALLVALQIGLHLVAYWQQHVLVIMYLLWAAFMVMVGAQLRREFDLTDIVFALAMSIVIVALMYAAAALLHQVAPSIFPAVRVVDVSKPASLMAMMASQIVVFISLVYLWASHHIKPIVGVVIGVVLITNAHFSGQASAMVEALQWPDMSDYFSLMQSSWAIFWEHPLVGAGWGQFAWQDFQQTQAIFTQVDDMQPAITQVGLIAHPHNLFMQLLVETGLIGFGIASIGFGCWLFSLVRKQAQQNTHLEHWWLSITLITFSTIAIFQNALAYAPVFGMLALILGVLEVRIKKLYFRVGPILIAALGLFAAVQLVQLNRQYNTLQYWYGETQFTTFSKAKISTMLDSLGALKHHSLLTPYIDTAIVRALPNNAALVEDKLALNAQLMQHSPNAQEVYTQAQLLAQSQQIEAAKQQLQLAIAKHPDYLYDFSIQLLKMQNAQVLPLLQMIVKHNKQVIEMEKNTKFTGNTTHKSAGKIPI